MSWTRQTDGWLSVTFFHGLKQEITDSDNEPLDIDSSLSKVESILTHLYINHQGKIE